MGSNLASFDIENLNVAHFFVPSLPPALMEGIFQSSSPSWSPFSWLKASIQKKRRDSLNWPTLSSVLIFGVDTKGFVIFSGVWEFYYFFFVRVKGSSLRPLGVSEEVVHLLDNIVDHHLILNCGGNDQALSKRHCFIVCCLFSKGPEIIR